MGGIICPQHKESEMSAEMRVQIVPGLHFFRSHESGIKRVVEAYCKYLPEFGVEVVGEDIGDYDIKAVHAGMAPDCDVAHLHGLYWTSDYEAQAWEWRANSSVVANLRGAKEVTVPSEWVAMTIKRDMRFSPHVIPHGIEWDEWAHHLEQDGGYVIWNKNRAAFFHNFGYASYEVLFQFHSFGVVFICVSALNYHRV